MSSSVELQRTVVVLSEYESRTVRCDAVTAAQMVDEGHVVVTPTRDAGEYIVRAGHKVGILRYNELELRIVPKVPVARLLYMASFSAGIHDSWKELDAELGQTEDPFSALAHALAFHSEIALRPTPIQGYVTHESADMRVRGRLLFDRQVASRAGVLLPAELRFDEYEMNIPENRVLKSALLVVRRFVQDTTLRKRLVHLLAQLDGVEPLRPGADLPVFRFTRLNGRYEAALALSRLVLEQRSLEYPDQHRPGTAFLFNMNHVFESYLESAVRGELEQLGGRVVGQHSATLDYGANIKILPDITWWRSGTCAAVLDAKYKRATSKRYPNADAYQMLAYCTRLGLRRGFLVYADLDGARPSTDVVRNADVEIVVAAVDVSGTIAEMQASVSALAAEVADLGRS